MDVIKGGGGGGKVGVGEEDMGDGMQCSDHPYRSNPGGICAFCLQEKLGKLVSSSFPLPIRGSSSSSSSPSFRSDIGSVGVGGAGGKSSNGGGATSLSLVARPTSTKGRNDAIGANNSHFQDYHTRRVRIPFLLAKKKKSTTAAASSSSSSSDPDIFYKRSKSTTTPRRRSHFLDESEDFSPRKRGGFWSFLYLSSYSKSSTTTTTTTTTSAAKKTEKVSSLTVATTANGSILRPKQDKCLGSSLSKKGDINVVMEEEEEDDSPNSQQAAAAASASAFERKVSRSRSVGCGSRSFSGDFFERISTGFGDCTLRRVESQREGKPKVAAAAAAASSNMKERVKCGGIFGGFIITSSSSSSSSSSYWVSSSAEEMNGKATAASGPLSHGRTWSWGWAFASPMRAFSSSKPSSSKDGKRDIIRQASTKNTTPNLAAIPSLLAVSG